MSADVWWEYLASHPDRVYCDYLVCGLLEGFDMGHLYATVH